MVEPVPVYEERMERHRQERQELLNCPSPYEDGWDTYILGLVNGGGGQPLEITSVVNALVKFLGPRPRREREEVKRHLFRRIGRLVHKGVLLRWRRRFVVQPPAGFQPSRSV